MTKRTRDAGGTDSVEPTPQRRARARSEAAVQRGPVTLLGDIDPQTVAIVDARGQPGNPYRTVDTIDLMTRSGALSAAMRQAADHFRGDYQRAGFETLRAMPLQRHARGTTQAPLAQLIARRDAHAALAVLGGLGSPSGSCVWHVVGSEMSLREWAQREGWRGRPLSAHVASGILIGALGAMAVHYGYENGD